jgi:hypothetical protein
VIGRSNRSRQRARKAVRSTGDRRTEDDQVAIESHRRRKEVSASVADLPREIDQGGASKASIEQDIDRSRLTTVTYHIRDRFKPKHLTNEAKEKASTLRAKRQQSVTRAVDARRKHQRQAEPTVSVVVQGQVVVTCYLLVTRCSKSPKSQQLEGTILRGLVNFGFDFDPSILEPWLLLHLSPWMPTFRSP